MKRLVMLLVVLVSVSGGAQAQVDFSGYGGAGLVWYDREYLNGYNNKSYFEGKLQADITISKHVDAQLDFRGHSDNNTVEFREFSLKCDYFKPVTIKVGHLRKPFGLEQFTDSDERDAIDHSYVHREFSERGYAGRGVMIMAYQKPKKRADEVLPFAYYVSLFRDNSLTSGAIGRGEYHGDGWTIGGGFFLQHNAAGAGVTTAAGSADIAFQCGGYHPSIEVFYAGDPVAALERTLIGLPGEVRMFGANAMQKLVFETGSDFVTSVEPFLLGGCFVPNVEADGTHTFQVLLGVNVGIEKHTRVRLNGDLLLHKTQGASGYTTYDSRLTAEVQVRF